MGEMMTPDEFHRKVTMPLVKLLEFERRAVPSTFVSLKEVDEREVNEILDWILTQRDSTQYRIGAIRKDLPEFIMQQVRGSNLRAGQVVAFCEEVGDEEVILDIPYSKKFMEDYPCRITSHTIVGFPRRYLQPVGR